MSDTIYFSANAPMCNKPNLSTLFPSHTDFRNCRKTKISRLSQAERQLLECIGLDANDTLLEVPKRSQGITSSGIEGKSHQNVFALVETFGGSQVFGMAIKDLFCGSICTGYTHSCWKTPEGELVDVTGLSKDATKFVPFFNYERLTIIYPLLTNVLFLSNQNGLLAIKWREIRENELIEHKDEYSLSKGKEILRNNARENLMAHSSIDDFKIYDNDLDLLFSQSSAFTGETLSTIRRKKRAIS